MLELRELVKVYKTKGDAEVRAIDGISVAFENTGMVFLLGKSGSGKSTLLNLCGGLDAPDSGEIVIKGRSSRDFSPSDFDSYRNTFVGFVFQEYNILDEFTVEENIAIALELQGKSKNKEQVNAILEQVDLTGYAKRKPNTLSGGQKQRVAIARALVKNPEIIMADEPTGALDSNTGRQVLETLKKLSAEKLVIVVSHDREFAETYGDRIIELKDGKIISDVTKTKIAPEHADGNLRFIGDDTISIKSGAKLTADDMERINRFLASMPNDVIITGGRQEIDDFRKATRIDEEGARETFQNTDEAAIAAQTYDPQETKFIRSRLPLRHAVRIGASSMKVKPVRLFFTILLTFAAFTMFGLFSTLTFFDKAEVSLNTYRNLGYETLTLQNNYRVTSVSYINGKEDSRWHNDYSANFTPDDLAAFREKYGNSVLGVLSTNGRSPANIGNIGSYFHALYYQTEISGFAPVGGDMAFWNDRLLTQTDLSSLGQDDIVISSYTFDSLKNHGLFTDTENTQPVAVAQYEDIVGQKLIFPTPIEGQYVSLTVRGVYRNDLPEEFESLKSATSAYDPETRNLMEKLTAELEYGIYDVALVGGGFFDAHFETFGGSVPRNNVNFPFMSFGRYLYLRGKSSGSSYQVYDADGANTLPTTVGTPLSPIVRFDGLPADTPLQDGEIIVPLDMIEPQVRSIAGKTYLEMINDENADRDAASKWFNDVLDQITLLKQGVSYTASATEQDLEAALQNVLNIIEQAKDIPDRAFDPAFYASFVENADAEQEQNFRAVGFYYAEANYANDGVYFSENDYAALLSRALEDADAPITNTIMFTEYSAPADAIYRNIIVPVPESTGRFRALLRGEDAVNSETDTLYTVHSFVSEQIDSAVDAVDMLSQLFLLIGVVMAVFSMLLLFNFISVSIANKKKEIGILRAVGARSTDVFKIFYSESAIITVICYLLAIIASYILCAVANAQITAQLSVALFVFGPLSWLVMLAIAVFTSFIATFLPVYSAAKRKPVESIRAL